MKAFNLKSFKIEPHHIVVAYTSEPDYKMERKILLEIDYDAYVVIEGSHCSCYDFNDSYWEATEYTEDELKILVNAPYNQNDEFWKMARVHILGFY